MGDQRVCARDDHVRGQPAEVALPDPPSEPLQPSVPESAGGGRQRPTRASAAWLATGIALLLLVLLIVFILQNTSRVPVHYLGLTGNLSLGVALVIAAVGGGLVVAAVAVVRITQLRVRARRARRSSQP